MKAIERTARLAGLALAGLVCLQLIAGSSARAEAYEGYTLFSVNNSTHSYMVDMSNAVVHSWTHSRPGGYSCYLLNSGNLLRPAEGTTSTPFNGGGISGLIQEIQPNGALAWSYTYRNSSVCAHHDIEPMPNGNVLIIAWEMKTAAQAVQAGLNHSASIWPDHIVEVQPTGATTGTIVWEWHVWDHLIQDYNPAKDNYGVVGDHPELIDINLAGGGLGGDWMHTNGISYNPEHDQIVFSCHNLNEIYVIDHSTTTAEAASHAGGNSGKGGDILYRWGKPSNYDAPGTQYFKVVHCAYWVPAGLPGEHNIMAFNNREGLGTSIVAEIIPPYDGQYNYTHVPGTAYGPSSPTWTYTAAGFYSNHLGGCQRVANGNTVIVESQAGFMFEVSSAGTTQWSYARGGEISRILRYGMDHPGLVGLGLTSSAGEVGRPVRLELTSGPNPLDGLTTIRYELPTGGHVTLGVYDLLGREVATLVDSPDVAGSRSLVFDASRLLSGVYFCRLQLGDQAGVRKLVVRH